MTIRKIAIPLKVGAAMAPEIAGVCVLTSVLDLIFCKCLSVQNVDQRIKRILNYSLILHAYLSIQSVLLIIFRACLWTTLRAFVDGQTCYGWLSEILCTPLMCLQRLSQSTGNRDVIAQSFVACSGSWIRKW